MARYRKYSIGYGDTIQSIAQSQAGSVELWHKIVQYNKLEYPYIVDTPEMKVKNPESWVTIGDSIIIPLEADLLDTNAYSLNKRDQELVLSLALGRDLAMTSDEEFYKTRGSHDEIFSLSASGKGDVETVQGIANLKQALLARLLTPRGSLLLHPRYGSTIHELIGKKNTLDNMRILEDEIVRTLKKDGRVESVYAESSYINEDMYHGEFTVNLHSLQEYFSFVIEGDNRGQIVIL